VSCSISPHGADAQVIYIELRKVDFLALENYRKTRVDIRLEYTPS
jgi:hypothetical protein